MVRKPKGPFSLAPSGDVSWRFIQIMGMLHVCTQSYLPASSMHVTFLHSLGHPDMLSAHLLDRRLIDLAYDCSI